jgi:hypothetical protein
MGPSSIGSLVSIVRMDFASYFQFMLLIISGSMAAGLVFQYL